MPMPSRVKTILPIVPGMPSAGPQNKGGADMKKSIAFLCILALLLPCVIPVKAADGNVTYSGDAGDIIFAPGSDYSPSDLFPNFKYVMPGDSITQTITVKNDASKKVKVKIYVRSLGAREDSVDFLSQLRLRVEKSEEKCGNS